MAAFWLMMNVLYGWEPGFSKTKKLGNSSLEVTYVSGIVAVVCQKFTFIFTRQYDDNDAAAAEFQVQGMSFIAAVLLLNMDDIDTFICFANLLNKPCAVAFFRLDENLVRFYTHLSS